MIGRRFVPKGKLNNQWNLIVRVCIKCNNKKSDLEDDISAISMGGTGDIVKYAQQQKKPITIINPYTKTVKLIS